MNFITKALLPLTLVLLQTLVVPVAWADGKPVATVVEYGVVAGKEQELLAILREHAQLTVKEEPGCLRFEVLKPIDKDGLPIPNRLMVSELYSDEAAAAAHAKSARLATLLSRIRPLLSTEHVTQTTVLESARR
jgi:(4S)-4-hydroxy-5-phosphonooxypentane-2,3-dione isomerase